MFKALINTLRVQGAIAQRMLVLVILFSSTITLLSTAVQMWLDYNNDVAEIGNEFDAIAVRDLGSIAQALWTLDDAQISVQLNGLFTNPDIIYAAIETNGSAQFVRGQKNAKHDLVRDYPIVYAHLEKKHQIGNLRVSASYSGIYQRLIDKVLVILVSNFIRTFLVSIFILYLFHTLVTRHLNALANYTKKLGDSLDSPPIILNRKEPDPGSNDELSSVVDAINSMREKLQLFRDNQDAVIEEHLSELLEERNFIATLLDVQEAPVLVVDKKGHVIRFNSGCEQLSGFTREEMLGQVFWEHVIPPENRDDTRIRFTNFKPEHFPRSMENQWLTKGGDIRTVAWTSSALLDDKKQVEYVVATGLDITDRRELEQQVVRQEKLATLGQLTASVSHELRNPISTVQASMSIINKLLADVDNDRLHRNLARVDRNVLRCNVIIDELLDYSRTSRLNKSLVEMDSCLSNFLEEHPIPENIALNQSFNHPGLSIAVDVERLRRVFINLVDNAFQAMMEKGEETDGYKPELNIFTGLKDGLYTIHIRDNGPGIPKDSLTEIFEPMFSTKSYGVGLGLAIARAIMESHGGHLLVDSTVGEGTTFTLSLPQDALEAKLS